MVAGHRRDRRDTWSKRRPRASPTRVRRRLLQRRHAGYRLRPQAVSARAVLDLPYFDHMHRFLPALALREGGVVRSVPVNHRPRRRGVSKYGVFDRLGVGIVDLFGVMWLQRRAAHPG